MCRVDALGGKLPVFTQDYHTDISGKALRYFQWIAINRTLEAIAGVWGQKPAVDKSFPVRIP
jgi:type I site-specific restriction endonuclease